MKLRASATEASLLDYLPQNSLIYFDEPRDFFNSLDKQSKRYRETIKEARKEKERPSGELILLSPEKLRKSISQQTVVYHSFFPGNIPQVKVGLYKHIAQREMEPFHNRLESLYPKLQEWLDQNYAVTLAIKNKALQEELAGQLSDHHLSGVEFSNLAWERGIYPA